LDRYAKACARNILRRFDVGHDWHRSEDIAQVLFLAGWQVWKVKGDEGLAKHRISSRAKNEAQRQWGRKGLAPGVDIRALQFNKSIVARRNAPAMGLQSPAVTGDLQRAARSGINASCERC
jgi:hypothetical protein